MKSLFFTTAKDILAYLDTIGLEIVELYNIIYLLAPFKSIMFLLFRECWVGCQGAAAVLTCHILEFRTAAALGTR